MHQTIELSSLQKERFTRAIYLLARPDPRSPDYPQLRYVDGLAIPTESGRVSSFSQGAVVFDLIHGVLYEVRGKDRLRRIFRIQLMAIFPTCPSGIPPMPSISLDHVPRCVHASGADDAAACH
jgi:hypothetical protein